MTAPAVRRRTHLLCLAVIVVLTLLWFAPVFAGKSYSTVGGHQNAVFPWAATPNGLPDSPQSDQADLNYPLQSELTTAAHAGTVPWWNPDSFGGQPLFSDGSSALLYPPKLLPRAGGLTDERPRHHLDARRSRSPGSSPTCS